MKNQKNVSLESKNAHLPVLPSVLWNEIFSFLNGKEVAKISIVCKAFQLEANKKLVWTTLSILFLSKYLRSSAEEFKFIKTKIQKIKDPKDVFKKTVIVLELKNKIIAKQKYIQQLQESLQPVIVTKRINLYGSVPVVVFPFGIMPMPYSATPEDSTMEMKMTIEPSIFEKGTIKCSIFAEKLKKNKTEKRAQELGKESLFSLLS